MLRAAGYRTGLYISPYIQRFGERIQINGTAISEAEIAASMTKVAEAARRLSERSEHPPTVFELVTAMGFDYFRQKNCDIVVLEVGLGGRLDATNVIDAPEAAVITRIGLDHTEVLGDTIAKIAAEKGGIVKPGCDVIVYDQTAEVTDVLEAICAERGAKFHRADAAGARLHEITVHGLRFDWGGYRDLRTRLTGLFQMNNAITAVRAAELLRDRGWKLSEASIREGLAKAGCIGRLELLQEKPVFLVDGAHNPQGVEALMKSLGALFLGRKIHFLMGVLADKDYRADLAEALPLAERFYAVTPPIDRALPAAALAEEIKRRSDVPVSAYDDIRAALGDMLREASDENVLCAFGSLYQIAEIRKYFGRDQQ